MTRSVAVIVLNWNNAPDTITTLKSLTSVTYPTMTTLVVDNGSSDGSPDSISAAFPEITVLQTGSNLGYAGGNNVGIRWALDHGAAHVLILNNDVRVSPDFLSPLVQALLDRPDAAAATPLVAADSNPCEVWALGLSIHPRSATVLRRQEAGSVETLRVTEPVEVDAGSGSALLVRREAIERVGLLDEDFYLYYEEVDWCMRMKRAGFATVAVPSSVIWHKVSATLGTDSPVIDYYMLRNQLRLVQKHWSGASRATATGRIVARNLLTICAYSVKSHGGTRLLSRDARLFALRDALLGRWGRMGQDVADRLAQKAI